MTAIQAGHELMERHGQPAALFDELKSDFAQRFALAKLVVAPLRMAHDDAGFATAMAALRTGADQGMRHFLLNQQTLQADERQIPQGAAGFPYLRPGAFRAGKRHDFLPARRAAELAFVVYTGELAGGG